ncbi:rod shape-determining protein MreC [Niastella yeongjuensis]|uniref:Cell shape-determining protein MreC n=1 Tax=Niastella yeongjuensis TaxID=354355 RepID=A0A1V9EXS3_9BACT|nr:rod shape-determining protein MreC [Niastella yeongjuensis]OQP50923.1 rod shape-determining protein MreC [Niastella yeongjuensis]SEN11290.1 rod shape-determining protein MreC [Niastella yeongjuensis]
MRNIFLFIRRYFNFVFFVVLQIAALYILFHYNKFHEAVFSGVANELTGNIGGKYSNITYYFHLKSTNDQLAKENEELRNKLLTNFERPDTSQKLVQDTVPYDTLGHFRKYFYRSARVVNNSVSLPNNTFTINRGENEGVHKNMGVISPNGVAGVVINTSNNYAVVMSLLHRQTKISASLKKTGETGKVLWDGNSPLYITLKDIPKSAQVVKGDSVVTSPYASHFPPGILIGTVMDIVDDKTSSFYTLRLKPGTNFFNVQYVMVVENILKDEQAKLEEETNKINQ